MKTLKLRIINLPILFGFTIPSFAAVREAKPALVCSYLEEVGLSTRGWRQQYDDVYGCSSPYKEIGTGYPLKNNLAYYVDGGPELARKFKIMLNVNNLSDAPESIKELIKAAKTLAKKVTGKDLPKTIVNAISNGNKLTTKSGLSTITTEKSVWPTGKGYEITFDIE